MNTYNEKIKWKVRELLWLKTNVIFKENNNILIFKVLREPIRLNDVFKVNNNELLEEKLEEVFELVKEDLIVNAKELEEKLREEIEFYLWTSISLLQVVPLYNWEEGFSIFLDNEIFFNELERKFWEENAIWLFLIKIKDIYKLSQQTLCDKNKVIKRVLNNF